MYARTQRGASMYFMLVMALLLGFVGLFAFKAGTAHMNNWTVQEILESIASEPEIRDWSNYDIRNTLNKKFNVNRVGHLNAKDRDQVKITTKGGMRVIEITYEIKEPFISNIALYMEFENRIEIPL